MIAYAINSVLVNSFVEYRNQARHLGLSKNEILHLFSEILFSERSGESLIYTGCGPRRREHHSKMPLHLKIKKLDKA